MPLYAARVIYMEDERKTIRCEVAYARPDRQFILTVTLPDGTTAREALLQSGILDSCPEIAVESAVLGVYGKIVPAHYRLKEGDRIEIYRPLACDPRAARRERVKITRRKP